ncbi:CYTH domain-containing protein [Cellulosilyticum sp. I15G10I2]|uniref:CYTH domain-containing protein n=1 Tax=Cellulosilyticum sp. I15G10I2 TaxID=1892843 RepID=UPI00085CCAFB|nr:CYTH domain-containing protein [Cellulosilyticum sp. I15G10I2]
MEIERKFLVKECPLLYHYPNKALTQGYIAMDPVIRIREIANNFWLTIKSKGTMIREEFELPITKEQYTSLCAKLEGEPIAKTRYFIPLPNDLTAELDIYQGNLQGLMTVEVEFPTLDDADRFNPPLWFGKDITYDNRYKNNYLSLNGIPK